MVFIIEKFEMIEGNLLKRTQKMIKAWPAPDGGLTIIR